MNNRLLTTVCLCMLCGFSLAQPKIVLKLDDIAANKVSGNKASFVMDYLLQQHIKASYGVIANRLDESALALLGKYLQAKNEKGEPMIEIWHHGYDHSNNNPPAQLMEYKGTSYALQKANFNRADSLVKKLLGVQMQTFGAPYNAVDRTTLRVVAANKNYHVLFYFWEDVEIEKQLTRLNKRVDIENGTGNPDFEYFLAACEKSDAFNQKYLVLQGHPLQWDAKKFATFKKIVAYLAEKKCTFVLPSELKNNKY
jgi:peptidoglycan/xylan/chitin deacetylase (PgdA/CDA1 family)